MMIRHLPFSILLDCESLKGREEEGLSFMCRYVVCMYVMCRYMCSRMCGCICEGACAHAGAICSLSDDFFS